MYICFLWLLYTVIGLISHAHSARPLIVDDARIVDAKSCQVESWMQKNTGSVEFWALPACNFTGNLELTAGGAMSSGLKDSKNPNLQLQAKTLFKDTEENGWGIGWVIGAVHSPTINTNRNWTGDLYSYVPLSLSFRDDRLIVNANIGWLYRRSESSRHHMTMGIGTEISLSRRLWLIAETFGQNHGKPFYHAGFRYWIVPDHIQIDTTYGNRMAAGNGEQWFTVGLRLISPAFLP
ncbi:MAG: hypothetical protein KF888_05630 [Nitrosomonas sp.]|nr:hypothetical protein [Nitrosomonas sp.]